MKLNLPSWATTILGLGAGVLAVLNQAVFAAGTTWGTYITVALIFLAGLGISPLVGLAFRSALHLSVSVSIVVSSALAALAVAVASISMSSTLHAILAGVLAFASALGFAPSITPAVIGRTETKTGGVTARTSTLAVLVVGMGILVMLWVVA